MGELQPIHYFYMVNNMLNWAIAILASICVRYNLKSLGSARYGVNANLALLHAVPFLNVLVFPYLLRRFESKWAENAEKIEFGFRFSLANSILLIVAALLSNMPSYLLKTSMQEMVENAGKTTSASLDLAGALLSNPIYLATLSLITVACGGISILIVREQRGSINSIQQQNSKR